MTLDSKNNTRVWFKTNEKTELYNLITKKLIRILKKTLRLVNTTTFISLITKNETSITHILASTRSLR